MVRNEAQYQKARALRQRGFSYSEIARLCGCSKATLSSWFKDESFSDAITVANKRTAAKENAKRMKLLHSFKNNEKRKQIRVTLKTAAIEYRHYRKSPSFTAGLMAYVCNGNTKAQGSISISSVNPLIHKTFLVFAEEYLGVSRETVKVWLLLNDFHDEEQSMRYWSKTLKLPLGSFYRNQFVKQSAQKPTLHNGVLNTIIGSTVLKQKLLFWVALLQKDYKIK